MCVNEFKELKIDSLTKQGSQSLSPLVFLETIASVMDIELTKKGCQLKLS